MALHGHGQDEYSSMLKVSDPTKRTQYVIQMKKLMTCSNQLAKTQDISINVYHQNMMWSWTR